MEFSTRFKRWMEELIEQVVERWVRNPKGLNPWHRHGTVVDATGLPQVRFDGEDAASSRRYPHLDSYTPVVGDRVYLSKSGQTWIILGKIRTS